MEGNWVVLAEDSEVLAVHAALLRTRANPEGGEILYFGGSQYSAARHDANQLQSTRLFNCNTFAVRPVDSPTKDVFCSGHSLLADGKLFVAGGTASYAKNPDGRPPTHVHEYHFPGLAECWLFDPADPSATPWRFVGLMAGGGRWYPGLATLGDGRVWIMCGHPEDSDVSRHNNNTPARFTPFSADRPWEVFAAPPSSYERSEGADREYPRLHLLPNGLLFCATVLGGDSINLDFPLLNQVINPQNGGRAFVAQSIPEPSYLAGGGVFTTTVLLPLLPEDEYTPRVLACGGYQAYSLDLSSVAALSESAWEWNSLTNQTPPLAWQVTAPRPFPEKRRFFLNAVILPTAAIFVSGGINCATDDGPYVNTDSVNQAELYEPLQTGKPTSSEAEWKWSALETASVARNYHSVALLLPDGRVWTAGSSTDHDGGKPPETRIEIYEPWYCRVLRPEVVQAPTTVDYRSQFRIQLSNADTIARVAVIRAGSVTHTFNPDQRYVGLTFQPDGADHLLIQSPPTGLIAPPGLYLLFVINEEGVPSKGKFIYIKSSWFSISPPGTASPAQSVTALWNATNPAHLDVFAVRGDGTVLSSFWEAGNSWVPWFSISPPGTASPAQSVTALWNATNPAHLDVFAVRGDGTVLSSFWEAGNSWVPWFGIGHPVGNPIAPQHLKALWSPNDPQHLDLLAISQNGAVWNIWWNDFLPGW